MFIKLAFEEPSENSDLQNICQTNTITLTNRPALQTNQKSKETAQTKIANAYKIQGRLMGRQDHPWLPEINQGYPTRKMADLNGGTRAAALLTQLYLSKR